MKLFGKNDAADGEETPDGAEVLDDSDAAGIADGDTPVAQESAAADGTEAEGGGEALSAPARSLMSAGSGSKKKLLILAGVLGLAGAGAGGYFFLSGDATPPVPLKPIHAPMAANPAAPGVAPVVAAQAGPPAAPVGLQSPPAAGVPASPSAAAVVPALPALATSAPAPVTMTPSPAGASAVPAVATAAPGLAPPPADLPLPAAVVAAGQVPASQAITGQAAAPLPAAAAGAAPVALPGKAMPGAAISTSAEEPPQDLPMPGDMGAAAPDQGALSPSAQMAAKAAGAKPGQAVAPGGKPSPAEMAIVQNAAVLDQLSQPAKSTDRPFDPNQPPPNQAHALKTVDQLLEEQAIIRPLPPDWVHVSVDHPAGGADERLNAAREALAQGNNAGALQLFSDLLQKNSRDKRALMGKAVALQKMGQNDEALAAYEAVLNNDPKNLEALTNMLGLLKAKDPKLALDKLVQLQEAYPYQADITAQLGVAYGGLGQYDTALKYLEMAEALSPSSSYIIYNKAVVCDKMGRSQQAGLLYRELLRMSAEGELKDALPLDAIRNRLAVLR